MMSDMILHVIHEAFYEIFGGVSSSLMSQGNRMGGCGLDTSVSG